MKYSEIKAIVVELHKAGYSKSVGITAYRKLWYRGDLRYGQMVTVEELFYARIGVANVLAYYEEKAESKMDEAEGA